MGRDDHRFRITRYLEDHTVDSSFGEREYNVRGVHTDDYGRGLTVRDDGDILLAGTGAHGWAFSLVRINTYGGVEQHVDIDFPGDSEFVRDVLELPDGKILLVGKDGHEGENLAVSRHHFDGTLDTTFGNDGTLDIPVLNAADHGWRAALQPDGKILISGHSHNGSNWDLSLIRMSYDGVLDTTLDGDGKLGLPDFDGADDYGYAVLSLPDGRILIAGRTANDIALVRLLGDFNFGQHIVMPTVTELAIATSSELYHVPTGFNQDVSTMQLSDVSIDTSAKSSIQTTSESLGDDDRDEARPTATDQQSTTREAVSAVFAQYEHDRQAFGIGANSRTSDNADDLSWEEYLEQDEIERVAELFAEQDDQ